MISDKNNAKIAIVQKFITVACMIVAISSGAFAALYWTGSELFRRDVELVYTPRLELLPVEEHLIALREIFDRELGKTREYFKVEASVKVAQAVDTVKVSVVENETKPDPAPVMPQPQAAAVVSRTKTVATPKAQAQLESDGLAAVQKAVQDKDYTKAALLLRGIPRSNEVNYYRAKVLFGLYLRDEAAGQQVITAWDNVRKSNPAGSKAYSEADSILGLFGR